MENFVNFALLGASMNDEAGEEVKGLVYVPLEILPEGVKPGDEGELEADGNKMEWVLLAKGGYDPKYADGPPSPEEIFKAMEEYE